MLMGNGGCFNRYHETQRELRGALPARPVSGSTYQVRALPWEARREPTDRPNAAEYKDEEGRSTCLPLALTRLCPGPVRTG